MVSAMMALLGSASLLSPRRILHRQGFEAGLRGEFNHMMYFRDLQPMLQVPLEEGCGQQDLFTFHAASETMAGLRHDVMLFSISLHEISNIIS